VLILVQSLTKETQFSTKELIAKKKKKKLVFTKYNYIQRAQYKTSWIKTH